jgi:hypothetical protein
MIKQKKYRSKKYTQWVKKQPSAISGYQADDPHHIIGNGQSATGTTASDLFTFPLTRPEHNELHQHGWRQWELRWESQWKYVAKTLKTAIAKQIIDFKTVENEINCQVINCDTRAYLKEELELSIGVDYE